jgi:hypothetical protein
VCAVKSCVKGSEAFLDLPFIVHVSPCQPVIGGHVEPAGELNVGCVDVEGNCYSWQRGFGCGLCWFGGELHVGREDGVMVELGCFVGLDGRGAGTVFAGKMI